jgi:mRNA-degrading endonuclease toxin of MazEF toxin-antitoxin module
VLVQVRLRPQADAPLENAVEIKVMTRQRVLVLSAAAIAASTTAAYAGPCSHEIGVMRARLAAMLEANAATGPTAPESFSATMHRQPTPGAVARAERRLGELSPQTVEAVDAALARALEADQAADKDACERALADVLRAVGP